MDLNKLKAEIATWPNITIHPHRFGGTEFRFGDAEVGHIHTRGIVDIPFPRSIHDALLAGGLAEAHHWVPNSGWTTFRIRTDKDVDHALWLMRLSYLRYALKTEENPRDVLENESEFGRPFRTLLERTIPAGAKHAIM